MELEQSMQNKMTSRLVSYCYPTRPRLAMANEDVAMTYRLIVELLLFVLIQFTPVIERRHTQVLRGGNDRV